MGPSTLIHLDPAVVRRARVLARKAGRPVVKLATSHTTVSVERATLRLAGLAGADADRVPWVNRLLDAVAADVGLEHGVALPVWDALARGQAPDLLTLAQKAGTGGGGVRGAPGGDAVGAGGLARRAGGGRGPGGRRDPGR